MFTMLLYHGHIMISILVGIIELTAEHRYHAEELWMKHVNKQFMYIKIYSSHFSLLLIRVIFYAITM